MKASKRISKRALCLALALCFCLPMLAGCGNHSIGQMVLQAPNSHVSYDGGKIKETNISANNITLEMTNVQCPQINTRSTGATVVVGEGASLGMIQCLFPATVKNGEGTVKNAIVPKEGSGTTFEKMPERLEVRSGAYCYVGGVLYDNRDGTGFMILEGDAAQPAAQPTPVSINGSSSITLVVGYAAPALQYTAGGTPAPTLSVSGSANATITEQGVLSIPEGLAVGTYTATVVAANSAGSAKVVLVVRVIDIPVLQGASGGLGNVVTLSFNEVVTGIVTGKDLLITEKGSTTPIGIKNVMYPGDGSRAAVTIGGTFTPGKTYTATHNGVSVDFVAQEPSETEYTGIGGLGCNCGIGGPPGSNHDPTCPLHTGP